MCGGIKGAGDRGEVGEGGEMCVAVLDGELREGVMW